MPAQATKQARTGQCNACGEKNRSSSSRPFVATLTSPSNAQARKYLAARGA